MRNGQTLTLWLDSAVAFRKKESGFLASGLIHGQLICALLRSIGLPGQKVSFLDSVLKGFWFGSIVVTNWWLSVFMTHTLTANGQPAFFGFGSWDGLLRIFVKIIWLSFCWLFVFGRKRIKRKPTGNTRWSQNTRLVSPFGQLKTRFSGFSYFS